MDTQSLSRLEPVLHTVEALGLFSHPRRLATPEDSNTAVLEGEVMIKGYDVTLQLVLDHAFPLRLPRFFLRPWDALGFIPMWIRAVSSVSWMLKASCWTAGDQSR